MTRLVAVAMALAMSAAAAQAAPGFATANVNIRTGPDIEFPSVGVIPDGEPLSKAACATNPGVTFSGTAAAAGSSASISHSTIAAAGCRCPT